ncbi:hypothetical protein AVEN_95097-1 [Araneus ventricosus]|uniref:Uncharacterized protein n=1 Tax=Araneus ventricosus TaxID=182803 RepID=A0A4Y2P0E9_ARAVE|nr:hypothetical protein AVEN_95097-1 [Araneus ventricosus]
MIEYGKKIITKIFTLGPEDLALAAVERQCGIRALPRHLYRTKEPWRKIRSAAVTRTAIYFFSKTAPQATNFHFLGFQSVAPYRATDDHSFGVMRLLGRPVFQRGTLFTVLKSPSQQLQVLWLGRLIVYKIGMGNQRLLWRALTATNLKLSDKFSDSIDR